MFGDSLRIGMTIDSSGGIGPGDEPDPGSIPAGSGSEPAVFFRPGASLARAAAFSAGSGSEPAVFFGQARASARAALAPLSADAPQNFTWMVAR